MKTVGIVGQVDHDNYGDILIIAMYIDWTKEAFQSLPVVFGASDIFSHRLRQLGCDFHVVSSLNDFVDSIDVCIFAGGGYLGRPDYSDILWQFKWLKRPTFFNIARVLRANKVPYYIEGAEIGPGLFPFVLGHAKYIVENAESVATRNLGSYKYLTDNFKQENTVYVPDVVLCAKEMGYFSRCNRPLGDKIELGIHATGKVLADNYFSKAYRGVLLNYIKDRSIANVMLINDQPYSDTRKFQLNCFADELDRVGVDVILADYDGVDTVVGNVSRAERLITSKLHLGVTALLLGSKVACIASHPKLKRYYADIKAEECYVDFYLSGTKSKSDFLRFAHDFVFDERNISMLIGQAVQYKERVFSIRDICAK